MQRAEVIKIDAGDKLVIPGLINAHYHSHDTMLRGLFEQLPLDAWMLYSGPSNYSRPSPSRIELRTMLGAAECLLNGITTVQDMPAMSGADHDQINAIVAAYEQSGIRVVLAPQISDRPPVECVPYWRGLPAASDPLLANGVDVRDYKTLIEEHVGSADMPRLSWAIGPSGPQRCTDDLLSWTAAVARRQIDRPGPSRA